MQWGDQDETMFDAQGHTAVDHLMDRYQQVRLRPRAGDMILFDGGRWFHKVDVVRGSATRWTIGGFLMFDRDGRRAYYWS